MYDHIQTFLLTNITSAFEGMFINLSLRHQVCIFKNS